MNKTNLRLSFIPLVMQISADLSIKRNFCAEMETQNVTERIVDRRTRGCIQTLCTTAAR